MKTETNISETGALRVLGPFAKQGGFYFRVVWPNSSRVLHTKRFHAADRWSSIIQRRISEASRKIQ